MALKPYIFIYKKTAPKQSGLFAVNNNEQGVTKCPAKLDSAAGVAPAGISSAARCRDFVRLSELSTVFAICQRKEESDEKVLVRVSPVI